MKRPVREKKHRLPHDVYVGEIVAAFTICIQDRNAFFTTEERFHVFEKILLGELRANLCDAVVYLFMPDHCHLLLKGISEKSDLLKVVKMFKQRTGFWFYKEFKDLRWEKGFYDHIVRDDGEIERQVRYILSNPLRANLVDDWKKYKYKGSSLFNLGEW